MSRPPCRKFGLLDAMILVASAAIAALSIRSLANPLSGRLILDLEADSFPDWVEYLRFPGNVIKCVVPWLAAFTAALLIISLRPPRPRFTRLVRQPGMAASLAAVSTIVLGSLLAVLAFAIMGVIPSKEIVYYYVCLPVIEPAGLAVGAVWFVMALSRRWRPQPGWIDRTGRVLGGCWVLVLLVSTWQTQWLSAIEFRFIYDPPTPQPLMREDQPTEQERRDIDRHSRATDQRFTNLAEEQARLLKQLKARAEPLGQRDKPSKA